MTYLIEYKAYNADFHLVKNGAYKVKNCYDAVHAQNKLNAFLCKSDSRINSIQIVSCKELDPVVEHIKRMFGIKD